MSGSYAAARVFYARQEPGQDASQRQEAAEPIDAFDSNAVCQPTEDGSCTPLAQN